MYVRAQQDFIFAPSHHSYSYFVTELLGTDLHRLLTSRPLEKQFIQYFLYQILVRWRYNATESRVIADGLSEV